MISVIIHAPVRMITISVALFTYHTHSRRCSEQTNYTASRIKQNYRTIFAQNT